MSAETINAIGATQTRSRRLDLTMGLLLTLAVCVTGAVLGFLLQRTDESQILHNVRLLPLLQYRNEDAIWFYAATLFAGVLYYVVRNDLATRPCLQLSRLWPAESRSRDSW